MKITNIVASDEIKFPFSFLSLIDNELNIHHNPETFPGAFFRLTEPKCSITIFASGKLICTGCKTKKEVIIAFNNVKKLINKYKKNK